MKRRRCTKCRNEMKGHKKAKCSPVATVVLADGVIYKGPMYAGQPCGRGRLFSVDSNYDGDFHAGKKHGHGVEAGTGYQYDGEWSHDLYHGRGHLKKADGSVFKGEFHNGLSHGHGEYKKDDITYSGQWRRGKFHGDGTLRNHSGVYVGRFVDGYRHGDGTLTEVNGNIFSGRWYRGMRDGPGMYTTEDSTYTGQWRKDCRHGRGTWTSKKQGVYIGEWKKDLRHNHGTHTYPNSSVYKGGWSHGCKTGYGTQKWSSGDFYRGFWLKDEFHGRGTLSEHGHTFEGEWEHNKREGQFVETLPDGSTSSGPWTNDVRHGTFTEPGRKSTLYIWGTLTTFKSTSNARKVVVNALVRRDYSVANCVLGHFPSLMTWKLVSKYDASGQTIHLARTSKLLEWFKTKAWWLFKRSRYSFVEKMMAHIPDEYRQKCIDECEELFDCLTLEFVANPWRVGHVSYCEASKEKLMAGLHLGELGRCPAKDPFTRQPLTEKSGGYLSDMSKKTAKNIYKTLMASIDKEKHLNDLVYHYTLDDLEGFIRNARDSRDRKTLKRLLKERDAFIKQQRQPPESVTRH